MTIISLLNQIENGEVVLPAIQRDFVWDKDRVLKLMDSIMRGYPIGIVLMWETYKNIQYRSFLKEYYDENNISFYENENNNKLKIVLDGQQRLQSLFIALYGKYLDDQLYFDLLSGRESEDFEEDKYRFHFVKPKEIEKWNSATIKSAKTNDEENEEEERYLVKVTDLFEMSAKEKYNLRKQLSKDLVLTPDDEARIEMNMSRFDEVLVKDPNILKCSIIDENKPSKSKERQTEADVLEIFVRINRQGTPLSRSDLIFSMLKLNWKDASVDLPKFVRDINQGNSFDLDIDFVIRCLFAVSDLGTKFNIDLLRNSKNIQLIQTNFEKCCLAIKSTIDIVQNECWCSNSRALGGYHTLVPFVYYLFHTPKHSLPNSEIEHFRKAIYIFGFAMPFSRYADSRLGKFIKDELKPLVEEKNHSFPLAEAIWWTYYWEGYEQFGIDLLDRNPKLALSLLQGFSGAKIHFQANSNEMDHIFPRSILRKKGYKEDEINHFANFWLLSKGKNQNKSNKHPKKYFADVPANEMKRAFIDIDMLQYNYFKRFIKERGEYILDAVTKKLNIKESDFDVIEE